MVAVGDAVPRWEAVADPERMKTMALLLRDPNPIHWDVDAVARLGLGDRPVNQGPTNMGYVVNALQAWSGDATALRSLTVRFLAPVLAGDRVAVEGSVVEVEESPAGDVVRCELWLDADGRRALSARAELLLGGG